MALESKFAGIESRGVRKATPGIAANNYCKYFEINNLCRRRDLNFQALHESVTYRLYERIECIERIKRIQHTLGTHSSGG